MFKKSFIRGKVLHTCEQVTFIAKGNSLYESKNSLNKLRRVYTSNNLFNAFPLTQRFFRCGFHHFLYSQNKSLLVVDNDTLFLYPDGTVEHIGKINGSRPLSICFHEGYFYYGEYHQNKSRLPINIWRLHQNDSKWEKCWTFDSVRHVHSISVDSYTNSLWVTTGDLDHESAFWCTSDHFSTISKVVGGCQSLRVVQPLFTSDSIFFGSDSPTQVNHIFKMSKDGTNIEKQVEVGNPIFYAKKIGNYLFFSSVVEPSEISSDNYSHIWFSDNGANWSILDSFQKDIFSMKYFQYGQIYFAGGESSKSNLVITPFATKNHNNSISYSLTNY